MRKGAGWLMARPFHLELASIVSASRPGCRITRVMQNGENRNSLRTENVKDEIWKPRYHCSTDGAVNDWARLWKIPYCLKALSNRRQELITESGAL